MIINDSKTVKKILPRKWRNVFANFEQVKYFVPHIDQFQAIVSFLYPLEKISFLTFSGGTKIEHWPENRIKVKHFCEHSQKMKFSIKNFFSKCDQILQAVGDTYLPRLQTFSVKTKHVQHQHTRQKKRLRHQHPCRLFTTNTRQISLVFIAWF